MLTIEQILTHAERTIAQRYLAHDVEGLRRIQLALGELMNAADEVGDHENMMRFRVLAAKAANQREGLDNGD